MLTSLLPASPSLSITLQEPFLFVHPPPSPNLPSHDPILRGSITLSLPKARAFRSIGVMLKGVVEVAWPDRMWQKYPALEKKLEIELGDGEGKEIYLSEEKVVGKKDGQPLDQASSGEGDVQKPWKGKGKEKEPAILEKGIHVFEFSFIIPSTVAPYERSVFGRTRFHVTATANSPPGGPLSFSSTLSASKPIEFIASGDPPNGEIPPFFEFVSQTFHEDIGLLSLRHSSPHLTVGALLHLEVYFPHPPRTILLHLTECYILQQFTLIDPTIDEGKSKKGKEKRIVKPLPSKKRLRRVGEDIPGLDRDATGDERRGQIKTIMGDVETTCHRWYRLPDCDLMRPTTLPTSETPIRVSHELITEMTYQILDENGVPGEKKIVKSTKEITVVSCCCSSDSIDLPSYESVAHLAPLITQEGKKKQTASPESSIAGPSSEVGPPSILMPPPVATSTVSRRSSRQPSPSPRSRPDSLHLNRRYSVFSPSLSPTLSPSPGTVSPGGSGSFLSNTLSRSTSRSGGENTTPSTPRTPFGTSPESPDFFSPDSTTSGGQGNRSKGFPSTTTIPSGCGKWADCVCAQTLQILLTENVRMWENARNAIQVPGDEESRRFKWEFETVKDEALET